MVSAPAWVMRLAGHIGRRGSCLLFLALLDLLYGYSLYVTEAPQRRFNLLLPWEAWGGIWMGVGAVCLVCAFIRRDRVAFALAVLIKTVWGLLFLKVWLTDHLERGWVSVIIWLAFALFVLVVAGWPEPVTVIMKVEEEVDES